VHSRLALTAAVLAAGLGCGSDAASPPKKTPPTPAPIQAAVPVAEFPHDQAAYTQGLAFWEGRLFESTGEYGQSTLREVTLETGEVVRSHALESRFFGEGMVVVGGRAFQLTWREGQGFIYDVETFTQESVFALPSDEGWGLTWDGSRFILSDGTSTLYFLDPETLQETGRITVRDADIAIEYLNELEYVNGEIYANVYGSRRIARIDPATGTVIAWLDLTNFLPPGTCPNQVDVLNGIAYEPESRRLFVTGKDWCRLYEIEVPGTSEEAPEKPDK